jgi:hypothetical protein
MGNKIIESYSKYGYDVFLTHWEQFDIYQIAIQQNGRDFTDINQQFEKKKLKTFPKLYGIYELIKLIKEWKHKYKPIYIGTPNEERSKKYFRILSAFGFNLKEDDFTKMVKNASGEQLYRS